LNSVYRAVAWQRIDQIRYNIDLALLSETHLKQHERFFIPNNIFYHTDRFPGRNGGTTVAVRIDIPHNHVDILLLVSLETIGVCKPIGISEVLLAAVYKTPGHVRNDTDITELLTISLSLMELSPS
jgi:hypothetical protein